MSWARQMKLYRESIFCKRRQVRKQILMMLWNSSSQLWALRRIIWLLQTSHAQVHPWLVTSECLGMRPRPGHLRLAKYFSKGLWFETVVLKLLYTIRTTWRAYWNLDCRICAWVRFFRYVQIPTGWKNFNTFKPKKSSATIFWNFKKYPPSKGLEIWTDHSPWIALPFADLVTAIS